MPQPEPARRRQSPRLLALLGAFWLLFAVAHLAYQLTHPVVEVKWETATELNTAGFHVHRSNQPAGEFEQVTTELIPSRGDSLRGAAYTFVDRAVQGGQTYYYLLEEIEYDLSTNYYDEQIAADVPYLPWWTALLTAVSLFVGAVLLVIGLREEKHHE
jgi:hypothetical protein